MLDPTKPLWLPEGSIRGLLALAVVGVYLANQLVPVEIVTLVLGFYFGARTATTTAA